MSTTTDTRKFQVGQIVDTGKGRDYVWTFEVIKRTAKFITLRSLSTDDTYRVAIRISKRDGGPSEWALPLGTYSMAPVVWAE